VVPVSEAEYLVWRAQPTAFDDSFVHNQIDLADLARRG
jgi:hypothetical protein